MRTIHCWSWALLAVLGFSTLAAADDVRWQADLETAKRVAAQNNRLILIHFWAPWCPPCRRLEQNVFQQQGVGPALESNFVLVKINLDEHPELQQQFNIRTIPCDVILTAQGRVVDKLQSKQTAQEYVHQMTQVAATAMGQSATIAARQSGGALLVSQPASQPTPSAGYCQVPGVAGPGAGDQGPGSFGPAVAQGAQTQQPGGQFAVAQGPTPGGPQYNDYWSQRSTANPPSIASQPPSVAPAPPAMYSAPPHTAPAMTGPGVATASMAAAPFAQAPAPVQPAMRQPMPGVAAQPKAPPMGLDGFCPVSLCEGELWAKGDPRWGVVHRGKLYLFAGPEQQQRFWGNPDHYSPVAAGQDPVLALDHGQTIEGRREHGVFFEGRVYLFANEGSLQRFSQSPQRYASEITQAMNRR